MTTKRVVGSPYFWAIVAGATIVLVAWLGRASYRPVITGAPAPEFTVTTLAGDTVSLSDYAGKVVLVNLWATWCAPCIQEMPSMQRLYDTVRADEGGQDFEILAVSIDARIGERDASGNLGGDLRAFAERYGLTFPILHDPTGDIRLTYQATGMPESFLVGRDGVIWKKHAGAEVWDSPDNLGLVRRLLER